MARIKAAFSAIVGTLRTIIVAIIDVITLPFRLILRLLGKPRHRGG